MYQQNTIQTFCTAYLRRPLEFWKGLEIKSEIGYWRAFGHFAPHCCFSSMVKWPEILCKYPLLAWPHCIVNRHRFGSKILYIGADSDTEWPWHMRDPWLFTFQKGIKNCRKHVTCKKIGFFKMIFSWWRITYLVPVDVLTLMMASNATGRLRLLLRSANMRSASMSRLK